MIDQKALPKHVAIIMDGNGRWAQMRGKDRVFGHVKGAGTAKNTVEEAARLGLEYLTLYAFSSENWSRPKSEISFLMKLLLRYIRKERNNLHTNNVKFLCVGQRERLSDLLREEILNTETLTQHNTGLTLTFCLSYGGRQEVVNAVRQLAKKVENRELKWADIDENLITQNLSTSFAPDPDLLIRTSGEQRLSNFLPWQLIYTELYFTSTYWPDFDSQCFQEALAQYQKRQRRFGTVKTTKAAFDIGTSPLASSPAGLHSLS